MSGIVFIGVKGSGKSTLFNRFFLGDIRRAPATKEEIPRKINGVVFYDTPDVREYTNNSHSGATLFVIVIDSNQPLPAQREAIIKKLTHTIAFRNAYSVVLATKCDLLPPFFSQEQLQKFNDKIYDSFNVSLQVIRTSAKDNIAEIEQCKKTILSLHLRRAKTTIKKELEKMSWSIPFFHFHNDRTTAVVAAILKAQTYEILVKILLNQLRLFQRSAGWKVNHIPLSSDILAERWSIGLQNKVTRDNLQSCPFYRRVERIYNTIIGADNEIELTVTKNSSSPH